jgi:predicted RNA-binding Zn-ribbon protein involved in translation (DUF1610 family)
LIFATCCTIADRIDAPFLSRPVFLGLRPTFVLSLAIILGFVLVFLHLDRRDKALRRRVQAAGGAICTHCGYELDREAEETTCPECGRHWNVDAVRRRWRKHGYLKRRSRVSGSGKARR